MRVTVLNFILAGAMAGILAPAADAGHHHGNINISTSVEGDDEGNVTDCSQISIRFDDERGARATEELPVAGLRSLTVHSTHNGGVRVTGWDQPTYSVKACKAAALASDLAQVQATVRGNEVSASGPDSDQWVVYFLVRSPRDANLDLDSHNGEIALHDVVGTIAAHSQNGPVAIKRSSGTMDVSTQNGPISLSGGSGNIKLVAQNGPISVKLAGSSWQGGSLNARTNNGPLSIKLPREYHSGIVVESDGHGPISCRADACRGVQRSVSNDDDDDRPRRMEFGSGAALVHLSTSNGPVSVKDE
jgi:hypothetical protein